MSLTFENLRAKLLDQYDVDLLCEVLQIEAEELIDRFDDRVETMWERLQDEETDDADNE